MPQRDASGDMLSCQQGVHACYSMLLVRRSEPKSFRIAVSVKPFIGNYCFRSHGNVGCGAGQCCSFGECDGILSCQQLTSEPVRNHPP